MPPADRRSEGELLRDQITREVSSDAAVIAGQVFDRAAPDVARQSNAAIDDRYRRAFTEGDRQYLAAEAQRDPVQFLQSAKRLGVVMPQDRPVTQQPVLPTPAQPNLPAPPPVPPMQPPPMTLPEVMAAPAVSAPAPAPPPLAPAQSPIPPELLAG